jgi:hypothetical protein
MTDLEDFVTDITPRRNYHVGKKLDGTKSLVRLEDYFMFPMQHTDGTTLYLDKNNPGLFNQAFNAYMNKYHPP